MRIVKGLRAAWPGTQIILRGGTGFCRDALLIWCESERVDYIVGLAKNARLKRVIGRRAQTAAERYQSTQTPARATSLVEQGRTLYEDAYCL